MMLTLFTREECGLCSSALYVLNRVRREFGVELEMIDIAAPGNERWLKAYSEHIPVVHFQGREVFRHRVDERRLRQILTEAAR